MSVEKRGIAERFLEFLTMQTDSKNFNKIRNVLTAFAVIFFWSFLIKVLFDILIGNDLLMYFTEYKPSILYWFFMACIWAPLWEEIAFRWAPYYLTKMIDEKFIVPVIIIVSVGFALLHNNTNQIMIQGVGGLILSITYIKNGYCLKSSIILHSLWNFMVTFGFTYMFR